jgi:hypothetical protein
MKYKEIFIGAETLGCTAATITEDAIDFLLAEVSIFSYMVGSSMINILREVTPVND